MGISDTSKLDSKISVEEERMVFAAKQIRTPIDENARKVAEQQQYEGEDKNEATTTKE